ncbi:MAG: DUF6930 domain-containing protein, partial [Anaerolineales bacterium]
MPRQPRQPRKRTRRQPVDLPQTSEVWGVGVVQLRLWITPDDAPPHRPYLVMVLDLEQGAVVGSEMFEALPAPGEVHQALLKAMSKPMPGAGRARRPERVLVTEAALADDLKPELAEIGVACESHDLL